MSTTPLTDATLAERMHSASCASDEVFSAVHKIMGGRPERECLEPDYFWPVLHIDSDPYDDSIEVILNPDCPKMTREQADKIMALGFGQVYESHGDDGVQWCETYSGECTPRPQNDGEDGLYWRARKRLETRLARLTEIADTLYGALERQCSITNAHLHMKDKALAAYRAFKEEKE